MEPDQRGQVSGIRSAGSDQKGQLDWFMSAGVRQGGHDIDQRGQATAGSGQLDRGVGFGQQGSRASDGTPARRQGWAECQKKYNSFVIGKQQY